MFVFHKSPSSHNDGFMAFTNLYQKNLNLKNKIKKVVTEALFIELRRKKRCNYQ